MFAFPSPLKIEKLHVAKLAGRGLSRFAFRRRPQPAWKQTQLAKVLEKILLRCVCVGRGVRSLFNALLSCKMLINVALYINDVSSKRKQI